MTDTFAADLAVAVRAPVAVRPYVLRGVRINSPKSVVLWCRHPGYSNPGATNETILGAASLSREMIILKTPHERTLAKARRDAKLIAAHAVDRWDNVYGRPEPAAPPPDAAPVAIAVVPSPVPVEMTLERVELLLNTVIDRYPDLFLEFSRWVSDGDNFLDFPVGDPAELGK